MPTTTVFTRTNITPISAPPTYYLPDANGIAMPANKTAWSLNIDQSNVPAGQSYRFGVEYQRSAQWTDKAGIVHPANEWLPDYASTFSGGPISLRQGGTTFINHISSSIGAKDSQGNMVEPYPNNCRVRVESVQAWLFPSITLTMS